MTEYSFAVGVQITRFSDSPIILNPAAAVPRLATAEIVSGIFVSVFCPTEEIIPFENEADKSADPKPETNFITFLVSGIEITVAVVTQSFVVDTNKYGLES